MSGWLLVGVSGENTRGLYHLKGVKGCVRVGEKTITVSD